MILQKVRVIKYIKYKNSISQKNHPKTLLNLNIGKYIAIRITPTKTPTIIIIMGSIIVDRSLERCSPCVLYCIVNGAKIESI